MRNDLLHWKTIEWGREEGVPVYSLGGAPPFHSRSGGTVVPIHRYRNDGTWTGRHDLREALVDFGRASSRRLPQPR